MTMISRSRSHLASVNESYFTHMRFAFSYGFKCMQAALMAFVHGLVPAYFETRASDTVQALADIKRHGDA